MSHDDDHASAYVTFAATYSSVSDAQADYDAIKMLYKDAGFLDTFDAAIVTRDEHGKVKILKQREEPTRHGGLAGAAIGLAVGAVVALFPGAAVGAALAIGTGGGAVIGAVAGHVAGGMSRKDLKDLGELLDNGQSGLVVVAATDLEARVKGGISHAGNVMSTQMKSDEKELRKAIEDAQAAEKSSAS